MELVFWIGVIGVIYPYAGYPLVLWVLGRFAPGRQLLARPELPTVSMIIPVHNEADRVARKVLNTLALDYPRERLQILFVSDGSTDATVETIKAFGQSSVQVVELTTRGGKAAALNTGLQHASNDILVFTDASIALQPPALRRLVEAFSDPTVGCVSGEDRIGDDGGEGLYGRFELALRRLESRASSIVGASGSFYAQRRSICAPFTEGMAPDFLSVLRTVEQGYRAISEVHAVGSMTSLKDPRDEFKRKVRTLLRGMTTLFAHPHLLNPLKYPAFSFALLSHKLFRWTVPLFLALAFVAPFWLLDSPFYAALLALQVAFYIGALVAFGHFGGFHESMPGRIALYFSSVNAAILAAWIQYWRGVRQELWTPSRR
jgi:cellulose synthase/poly-beta-1,6-N-acetylglucosamine synthase-like glycosyltransferase